MLNVNQIKIDHATCVYQDAKVSYIRFDLARSFTRLGNPERDLNCPSTLTVCFEAQGLRETIRVEDPTLGATLLTLTQTTFLHHVKIVTFKRLAGPLSLANRSYFGAIINDELAFYGKSIIEITPR